MMDEAIIAQARELMAPAFEEVRRSSCALPVEEFNTRVQNLTGQLQNLPMEFWPPWWKQLSQVQYDLLKGDVGCRTALRGRQPRVIQLPTVPRPSDITWKHIAIGGAAIVGAGILAYAAFKPKKRRRRRRRRKTSKFLGIF